MSRPHPNRRSRIIFESRRAKLQVSISFYQPWWRPGIAWVESLGYCSRITDKPRDKPRLLALIEWGGLSDASTFDANKLLCRGGNYWNYFFKICTHITCFHYITSHYTAEIYDFTHFYRGFRTFMTLQEHNKCGNLRYFLFLATILYICETDSQLLYTTLHE